MGDTTDGPSSAAQSALSDTQISKSKRGFFSRIVEALSPSDTPEDITPVTGYSPPLEARGMMNLRSMRVEDVMIPKADIVAVPVTINRDDLVQVFRDSGLTRLPVFDGTLDTPIGFVNLKDFALTHGFNGRSKAFNLRDLARTLLFVPPSMPLGVLLQKMQAERIHMALVIDEYGGSDGLVTIEDLIEQVVGEIEDEHDADEDTLWVLEKPGVFMVEAKAPLDEFESEIGMPLTEHEEIDEEEIDTLGGLVFMLAGHVPARGEVIVHPEGPEFEVVEADPRRIKRLRVRLTGTSSG
ncbi:hemolysin family protein [Octadecabacter sp. 1_MG-2023]|uniref:hemolysin family protein n=1 Tax=unclassified Octadecabacter TaxID=196158 RepID=UPI001C0815F5|nr:MULTISPECIES: hemolysin family protein [unclassified Octadecabacter]MBU2994546.1 hemolysin family protein [Octadecabacter sp. B2R22]MDO6734161.1 hemolysin family protein [Octadecabacter sp. 1_MG-2023]